MFSRLSFFNFPSLSRRLPINKSLSIHFPILVFVWIWRLSLSSPFQFVVFLVSLSLWSPFILLSTVFFWAFRSSVFEGAFSHRSETLLYLWFWFWFFFYFYCLSGVEDFVTWMGGNWMKLWIWYWESKMLYLKQPSSVLGFWSLEFRWSRSFSRVHLKSKEPKGSRIRIMDAAGNQPDHRSFYLQKFRLYETRSVRYLSLLLLLLLLLSLLVLLFWIYGSIRGAFSSAWISGFFLVLFWILSCSSCFWGFFIFFQMLSCNFEEKFLTCFF